VILDHMKVAPKLAILVGVALLGLCGASAYSGYPMRTEMFNVRIDQAHAIVDVARNMAVGSQKQVKIGGVVKLIHVPLHEIFSETIF
jgi:methyl-accepting chemotaxis protein